MSGLFVDISLSSFVTIGVNVLLNVEELLLAKVMAEIESFTTHR